MTVVELISRLGAAGIKLWLEDDQLKFKAPKGALTAELKDALVAAKAQVIEFLKQTRRGGGGSEDRIPSTDRSEAMPLSFAQQRLWFVEQLAPGNSTFHIPSALYLKGILDVRALHQAFNAILERHEALRTVYETLADEPRQRVLPAGELHIPFVDLSDLSAERQRIEAKRLAEVAIRAPFDLARGPMIRAQLFRLDDHLHSLVVVMHHIASDGWSMDVFVREMALLYAAFRQGNPSPLPPLEIQYGDFSVWQRGWLQGENLDRQLNYWRTTLANCPEQLKLPFDRPRPALQTSHGAALPVSIDKDLAERLRALARKLDVTPYILLFAASQVLFSRWSGQTDLFVGMPVAGRTRGELEPLIGFFVNTLVVRGQLGENPSFADFVAQTRERILQAQAHQDLPFEAIVDSLNVPRNLAFSPLAQVAFSFINSKDASAQVIGGLEIEPMPVDLIASRQDLTLMLVDKGNEISGIIEYNTDLFDAATMQAFADQYAWLLAGLERHLDTPVRVLPLWPDENLPALLGVGGNLFDAVLPLSPAQTDVSSGALKSSEAVLNSVGYAVELPGTLDPLLWQQSLQQVSDGHPRLRSVLFPSAYAWMEPLYQAIKAKHTLSVVAEDLRDHSDFQNAWSQPDTRQAWLETRLLRRWDLSQGVGVQYELIRVSENLQLALVSAHESVMDSAFLPEHFAATMAAYQALRAGQPSEVLGNAVDQWRAYVLAQRANTDTAEARAFWKAQLASVEPLAIRQSDAGVREHREWRPSLTERDQIAALCARHHLRTDQYFLLLYGLALQGSHYEAGDFAVLFSGQKMAVLPTVFPALAQCADWTVAKVAEKLLTDQAAIAERARTDISQGLRDDYLGRDVLRFCFEVDPFFAVPQAFDAAGGEQPLPAILSLRATSPGSVRLRAFLDAGEVVLALQYFSREFADARLLDRMRYAHSQLAKSVQGADSITVRSLNWLLPDEAAKLACWQGPVESLPARSVAALIAEQINRVPENIAVIRGKQTLTYKQLDALSNQIAHWLVDVAGLQKGERVGLCFGRSLMLPVAVLGAVKAGAVYVPMDANYPPERLQFLLQDSAATAMLSESCVLERVREQGVTLPEGCSVLALDLAENLSAFPTTPIDVELRPKDGLYMVYTSGSTGLPKGAGVRHSGELNLLAWYTQTLQLGEHDRGLLLSAFGFDLTQKNLFALFASGGALVIPELEHYDPDHLAELLTQHRISMVNGAPSAFYPLVEDKRRDGYPFPALRNVALGGEPIRLSALSEWLSAGHANLINSYGPTECTDVVAAWTFRPGTEDESAFPIGNALPNTSLYVTDTLGRRMPVGTVGELRIAGIGVGTGYHQRDALNQEVFQACPYQDGQWYCTGDLVYYRKDGALIYKGRKDFQVKLRGLRIEPGEVDSLLKASAGISDALTLVRDEQLVSYVISAGSVDREALRDQLKSRLPEFMVPSAIVPLVAWPLTPNGKIDRKALPSPASYALEEGAFVAPRNDSERQLADIWQQVLRRENISVTANFFDIGGHSLLATQVVSRIRQQFKIDIHVRAIFEAPTIEQMVRYISTASSAGLVDDAPPMHALATPNRDTLSFAQYRLWFIDQLNQGSSEYNLPSAFRIEGPLDVAVLDRVFTEIVRRHEALRTRFLVEDGMPKLDVVEPFEWQSPLEDLSRLPQDELNQKLKEWVDQDANKTFQLATDLLFSTRILKLSSTAHVLLMNMHHIIADGWSIGILIREVQALYQSFSRGQPSPLSDLALQYSDFAVWQRQWLSGDVLDKLRQYWLSALRGAPDVLRLPTDKPRPKQQTFNGAHSPIALSKELSGKIDRLCEQQGLTSFMVLMGAYQILLSRYTGQNDITVGIPIAGRTRAEIEGLIGFFINGLVIRTRLDSNPSVIHYLQRVREAALGAYAHQDMPFDVLADALQFERGGEHAPGAQVGFALQNTPDEALQAEGAGLTITSVPREHKTAKYELTLILEPRDGCYSGVAEYNTDLFVAGTIENMMLHYTRILEQMVANPEQSVDGISLVERQELYGLLSVDEQQYELAPLSPMQRDMYLDTLLAPATLKNSMGLRVTTPGPFDLTHWLSAAQYVIDQTPILRASLQPSDKPYLDVAYLKIARKKQAKVTVVDWSDRTTSDEQAEALTRELVWRPYDIHHDDLVGTIVYKLDGGRYLLAVHGNHILLDGMGMFTLFNEHFRVAETLSRGETPKPIPYIFPEFVAQARLETDTEATLAHWKSIAPSLEAVDFSLPPQCREAAAMPTRVESRVRLSDAHWQQIRAWCKKSGVHPAYYFKAIYGLLINTYCRAEEDFYISEVLGGRSGAHRQTYGNYFHVTPVVFPNALFSPQESFGALVEYVAGERKRSRDLGPLSLMAQRQWLPQGRLNFMFNYYNFMASSSLWGTPLHTHTYPQVQDGPLQFVVHDQDGWIELVLIYLSSQFDDLRFCERMVHLSEQFLNGTDRLDQLSFVLPDERQALRDQASGPHVALIDGTVVDQIQAQVFAAPNAVAVRHGQKTITYSALDQSSNQLARHLVQSGVGRGMRVGICLDRGIDLLVAVLGVLKSGAAYVPMDANYPSERLSYILDDAQAPVLITQECVWKRLSEEGIAVGDKQVLLLDAQRATWSAHSVAALETRPAPDDLIYIIYTSGSTGLPKGAAVYHRGEVNLLQWYREALSLTADDRFLLVSAIGFDLTQKNLFAPLTVGASIVLPEMEQYDVDVVADTVHREGITVINCAPSAFYPVAEKTSHSGYPFPSLRFAVLGGEPIRYNSLQAWLAHPQSRCKLMNSYGPTECSDVVAAYTLANRDAPPWDTIPLGSPVCNTRLQVLSESGAELPAGLVGELHIAGEGVGAGYLNRDELTAESFIQRQPEGDAALSRWYRTGDLVRRWPDGELEYIGRRDFQIKLRGLRIELGEIETALRKQTGIQDSLTLVLDDRLVSYVVSTAAFDDRAVRQALRAHLPEYMIPAVLVALPSWPLTPNGKIDRKALPAPDAQMAVEFVAPRSETEERIAAIWRDVLGIEKVGVFDDFFDLGGHSLLAARAVSKFRAEFQVEIPLRALFEMHTVADIATYLDTLVWAARNAEQGEAVPADESRDEGFL
ncbi:Non-ribosomal peptide synthase [gamma proteobacterium HdN1]|nr:Non-ribosomal peptide synthase [gamma proteobacterium HdN1]